MNEKLKEIKALIQDNELDTATTKLKEYICSSPQSDEAYYLLGNLYRKQGNWQLALNNYLEAINLNSNSPAVQAHTMLMDILNFYNKDMYNQ
ncbi:MAG: tetratricopeptide repeat protein [Phocaeicola sp.]|uniref:tetratricopeptide repeat protein n=1 Tax=Phocaeicola TaxID=909656 RepID=UPI00234F39E7|nr:tetratricopeptide repeat protein [Phocaeicola oris]MCE2615946.1 tetratricopeptide repeat protein [Phocaeicola oris]